MNEAEPMGILGVNLEMVLDNFCNRDKTEYLTPAYLLDNMSHMREHQPLLAALIDERPIDDFREKQYFVAGAATTYDLIHMTDPTHWEGTPLTHHVILTTLKNFQDSAITDEDGRLKSDRDRAVVELEWFYNKLTEDSPRYTEWLEWVTTGMKYDQLVDFLYGSLITAMPFYLTREGEKLEERFHIFTHSIQDESEGTHGP